MRVSTKFRKRIIRYINFLIIFTLIFPHSVFALFYGDEPYYEADLRTRGLSSRSFNTQTGAFVFNYPIKTPAGRNGIEPNLELQYNSQAAENISIMGHGWSLNIPSIERINRKGLETLYTTQKDFHSSLSGELVEINATNYGSKVDNGEFLRYQFSSNIWTVTDKSGKIYKFGNTASSRQDNPNDSSKIYKWMIEEIRDTNNNFIKYEYFKNSGQIYPSKITYTGNGSTDGIYSVEFFRESRLDNVTSTNTGFNVVTNERINEIKISVNGNWVRKYQLTYTTGDNGKRSVIQNITETGRDESGNTLTLPSTIFSYQTKKKSWTASAANFIPEYFVEGQVNASQKGIRIFDVNADGLQDIVKSYNYSGGNDRRVYINRGDGTGWYEDMNYVTTTMPYFQNEGKDYGVRIMDVNGDGFQDLVYSYQPLGGPPEKVVYINDGDGTGWTQDTNYTVPVVFTYDGGSVAHVEVMEVNGDGLPDIVQSCSIGCGTEEKHVWINKGDGTGWMENTGYTSIPAWFGTPYGQGFRVMDINGDGLDDLVQSILYWGGQSNDKHVYINKGDGTGWLENTGYTIPEYFFYDRYDQGVRIMDVDGDVLPDLVKSSGVPGSNDKKVYINKGDGTGWVQYDNNVFPSNDVFVYNNNDNGYWPADMNGDGLPDFIQSINTWFSVEEKSIDYADPLKADLLFKIVSNKGGETKVIYKHTAEYRNGSTLLNPKLPFSLPAVYQVVTHNGLGTRATSTYQYSGGEYYYNNPLDRKFAGFGEVTATDGAGNVTKTFFHQGNATNSALGEYSDHVSKIGKPYRVETYDAQNNLYSKTINKWEHYGLGNGRNFIKLTQSLEFSYDGDSDHRDIAQTFIYDNVNGNLTQKTEWGEVNANDDGTFTDIGTDKFISDISYAQNQTAYILGLPSQETVTNQSAQKEKETRLYYDNLALGQVSIGNNTKSEFWKTGITYIDTEKTYNGLGLVTQEKDPRDKITNHSYDSENLFVTTSTNPLGQKITFAYDYSSGKVASTTDSNYRTRQIIYDAFDRVKEEKAPDPTNPTNLATKTLFTYTDAQPVSTIQKTSFLDANISFDVFTYIDGLERPVQERKEAEDTNTFAVKDFHYNKLGLVKKETLPYFSTGSSKTASTSDTTLYANYLYDSLKRVGTTTNVLGNTVNTYDDWKVTVTDAEGNQKELFNDAYRRLTKVREYNDGVWYDAGMYSYNYLSNLFSLTDADGNLRNFTYDGLGRRLTAQDLHAPADTSFGAWTYGYDDAGNLTTSLNPNTQTTNYTYDDINRVLTEDFTGQAGTEVLYLYDNCIEGIGRLCQAVSSGATTTLVYNGLGLVKDETRTIDAISYITKYTYDRQGNTTLLTYPDNSEAKYDYNTAGLLEKLSQRESGGTFVELVNDFDYFPLGQVAFEKFYNGLETKYIYDSAELYRLKKMKTASSTAGFGMALFDPQGHLEWSASGVEGPLIASFSIALDPEFTSPSGGTIEGQPTDLLDKRTKNTKTYLETTTQDGAPVYKTEFYPHDIHYFNAETKQYENIDTTLQPETDGWSMTKAPYSAKIKNTFGENFVTFENNGQKFSFSPLLYPEFASPATARVEGPSTSSSLPSSGENDPATSSPSPLVGEGWGEGVIYPNALGLGIDISVTVDPEKLQKQIIIQTKETLGDLTTKQFYEIPFKLASESDREIDLDINGRLLSELQTMQTSELVTVRDNAGGLSYILPPYAKDAQGNTIPIEILYEKQSDGIHLTKKLPVEWLESAVYPITTDATLSYNAEYGDGWVSKSDYGWDYAHHATNGSNSDWINTYINVSTGKTSGGTPQIERAFVPFNTSSLPDNADILDAKLKLYITSKENSDNDNDDWLTVVQTTQNSTASLTTEDYDQCGYVHTPTEGIDTTERKDITNITTSQYLTFVLNQTGRNWISKTSYTKLGLREGHDIIDSAYAGVNSSYNRTAFSSRESGTFQSPKLEVTYTTNPLFMQEIAYTYDKVGNITKIQDTSMHNGSKTSDFTYDNLYRLKTTTVTNAKNGQNYTQTYTYNRVGNILNKSDVGSYLYQGNQGTNYANPHAVTDIAGKSYTYDNNGNLLNNQSWAFSWDYNNRLTQTASSTATSTYKYDHTTQRVRLDDGSQTTHYPNKYYNTSYLSPFPSPSPSPSPTPVSKSKHVFANNKTIATVDGTGLSVPPKTFLNHNDHLGGSNVLSDQYGRLEQLLDYYPFGSIRIDQRGENLFNEQRKFSGHEYDGQTSLSYMGARYYPGDKGRFLSQDPATKDNPIQFLSDPQQLNYYSYTRNNPLINIDPNGESLLDVFSGFGNAYLSNNAFGAGRISFSDYYGSSRNDYELGQNIGDFTSVITGSFELFAGSAEVAAGAGGGLVFAPATGGASVVVGAAGVVQGSAIAGHGASTAALGAYNLMSGKGSGNEKRPQGVGEHSQKHYPNLTPAQIENLAKQTKTNADIKVTIKDWKKYFYDSKNNNLFIDNPAQPTVFQPEHGKDYIRDAVKNDIEKGGRVK